MAAGQPQGQPIFSNCRAGWPCSDGGTNQHPIKEGGGKGTCVIGEGRLMWIEAVEREGGCSRAIWWDGEDELLLLLIGEGEVSLPWIEITGVDWGAQGWMGSVN